MKTLTDKGKICRLQRSLREAGIELARTMTERDQYKLQSAVAKHKVRAATKTEAKEDCCGDRWPCYVEYICSCGLKGCSGCMREHLLDLHKE